MKFLLRLEQALENFNLESAEALSIEIHEAEAEGYEVSPLEDRYWLKLTDRIQQCYR